MPYTETLAVADAEFGNRLWNALRNETSFGAVGAYWLYDRDADSWHLTIATNLVEKIGARDAYLLMAELTKNIPAAADQLLRIELISPNNPLYSALKAVFGNNGKVAGKRVTHSQVQGMYVEDAYLYEIR